MTARIGAIAVHPPDNPPDVSVLLPVFHTETFIPELARRITRTIEGSGRSCELLFVDDASPDGAEKMLAGMAARDPRISAIVLERNAGQHRAVYTALRFARGGAVVVMDADLQDAPEHIPILLEKLDSGFGVAFAGRRGRYESLSRLVLSKGFKWILHLVSGSPPDAGMFFACTDDAVRRLLRMRTSEPQLVAMLGQIGLPTAAVPLQRFTRPGGVSGYTTSMRFETAKKAIACSLRIRFASFISSSADERQAAGIKRLIGSRFRSDRF